jgi:hypothetical protein
MASQRNIAFVKYARKSLPFISDIVLMRKHVPGFSSNNKSLVDEVTTLRRHLEANHSVCAMFMA